MIWYKIMDSYWSNSTFNEADIRSFLQEPRSLMSSIRTLGLTIGGSVLVLAIGFVLLNLNTLWRIQDTSFLASSAQTTILPSSEPTISIPTGPTPAPIPNIPENTLIINDLGISAPVLWETDFDEKIIEKKLQEGVVHFKGTARPGEQGTVVITGHSSNYPWKPGSYNNIFTPILKAINGQKISLLYHGSYYEYQVTKSFEVKPTQLDVLSAGSRSGIRLITCTPLGTSLRRLVVEAEQIIPDQQKNTPFTHATFSGQIPAAQ